MAVKIKFEIDKKIKFVQLDFSNSFFQKSSADQQGDRFFTCKIFGMLLDFITEV